MKNIISIIISIITLPVITAAQNIPDGSTLPTGSGPGYHNYPVDFGTGTNPAISLYNYTRVYNPIVPMTSIPAFDNTRGMAIGITTNYTDGWGRTLMSINRNNSGNDIVTPYDYRYSKVMIDYLPYADSFHSTFHKLVFSRQKDYYSYKYPAEGFTAYAKQKMYNDYDRFIEESYQAGRAYVGEERGSKAFTEHNVATEVYFVTYSNGTICKSGYWGANQLLRQTAIGQHGQKTVNYTDKNGKLICKKAFAGGTTGNGGWLTTYYLYDDFDKLIYVLPPKAFAQLDNNNCISNIDDLCFSYTYNEFGKIESKGTPGKTGKDYIVYDVNFRPVLTQTPQLHDSLKWAFSVLDPLGRLVCSGLYSGADSLGYWNDVLKGNIQPKVYYDANSNIVPEELTLEHWLINGSAGDGQPDSIFNCQILTFNYYDTYDQWPANLVTFDSNDSAWYMYNTGAVYPRPYYFANGKLVASRTRILNNGVSNNFVNEWITNVNFYDEKGRIIQTQTLNPWNIDNWDINTTQYNFAGKPILSMAHHHSWQQSQKPQTDIYTKFIYGDKTGRLWGVEQKIDTCAWESLSTYAYDEMGRVKTKWLGGKAEVQNYTYNINGQLIGINASQLMDTLITNDSMTYWEDLSRETGFSRPRYDGAVSGFRWRSAGGPVMAYGYSYDNAGRMTGAEYRDASYSAGSYNWNKSNRDFSVSGITYDANGNILTLNQRGYDKGYNPADIDQLEYYYDSGNKLLRVEDNTSLYSPIHDFENKNAGKIDYDYDADGNLTADANKGVNQIAYNYLDLPLSVNTNSGNIQNIYDAAGTLLQKTITENNITTVYRYWGGLVYKEDSLQYILNEEGRARWLADSSKYKYDFFVKDHLGNVRTVVTSDVTFDTIGYHAGFEVVSSTIEEAIFHNINNVRDFGPVTTAPDNLYSGWLYGSDPDKQVGAALLVHAMAGDQFNLKGYGYYEDTSTANFNTYALPEDMLSSLLGVLTGGASAGGAEGSPDPVETINNLLTTNNYNIYENLRASANDPNYPQAYLNYLVFTEDMVLDEASSQVVQLRGQAGSWTLMEIPGVMTMPHNGYLLCYFSNQSAMQVAIDNIYAIHYKGRLLEEQHYYPHGLVIEAGGQQNTPLKNKYLYEGKKLQDELGLQLYDFHARQYDPQIGRFWGIDPMDQFPSGYTGLGNDPANMIDPSGMAAIGAEITAKPQEKRKIIGPSGPPSQVPDMRIPTEVPNYEAALDVRKGMMDEFERRSTTMRIHSALADIKEHTKEGEIPQASIQDLARRVNRNTDDVMDIVEELATAKISDADIQRGLDAGMNMDDIYAAYGVHAKGSYSTSQKEVLNIAKDKNTFAQNRPHDVSCRGGCQVIDQGEKLLNEAAGSLILFATAITTPIINQTHQIINEGFHDGAPFYEENRNWVVPYTLDENWNFSRQSQMMSETLSWDDGKKVMNATVNSVSSFYPVEILTKYPILNTKVGEFIIGNVVQYPVQYGFQKIQKFKK